MKSLNSFRHWYFLILVLLVVSVSLIMTDSVYAQATCYALTLSHTGSGTDPTADPANSDGCPAGQYLYNEDIDLSGGSAGHRLVYR